MHADWTVQLEDGSHAIHAEIAVGLLTKLKITWDSQVVDSSTVWVILGDLKSFERNGHSFLISVHGLGLAGRLALSMDGVKVPEGSVAGPTTHALPAATVQFIKELSVRETEEVVATERYPLDNRFGDQPLTAERQISREYTNELTLDTGTQLGGRVGVDILSAIKAEIEAHISQQTGSKIGEKVTESQTIRLSVGPRSSVLYEVVWKRKVRVGERLYISDGNPITVPYRVEHGLAFEVRTPQLGADQMPSGGVG